MLAMLRRLWARLRRRPMYASAVHAAQPAAYWRLDDQDPVASDASGNAQHGRYVAPRARAPVEPNE